MASFILRFAIISSVIHVVFVLSRPFGGAHVLYQRNILEVLCFVLPMHAANTSVTFNLRISVTLPIQ